MVAAVHSVVRLIENDEDAAADLVECQDTYLELDQMLELIGQHGRNETVLRELCRFHVCAEGLLSRLRFPASAIGDFIVLYKRALTQTQGLERTPMPDVEQRVEELRTDLQKRLGLFEETEKNIVQLPLPDAQSSKVHIQK